MEPILVRDFSSHGLDHLKEAMGTLVVDIALPRRM